MDDGCYHVPTSEGQSMCRCLDKLMWLRLAFEGACRRVVELEEEVQRGRIKVIELGGRD